MDARAVTTPPGPRLVVLGASNLSRGLPRLVAAARARSGLAIDCFVAAGHGRSYGATSRVGWRRLPSILACGLWRALDRLPPSAAGPLALVCDVGNDLLYGVPADEVAAWVATAVRRLESRGARVTITRLPVASVDRVGPVRFRALKTVYVPGCRLRLDELKAAASRLDDCLAAIANAHGAALVDQPGAWYGVDAIHVRRRRLDHLWDRVCTAWGLPERERLERATVADWMRIGLRGAEVRAIAGSLRLTPQPAVQLADGSRVWLY